MIYFPGSRIEKSVEMPLVASTTLSEEGLALAGVMTAGAFGVRASTTAGTDIFVGFSLANLNLIPSTQVAVETYTQGAGNTITTNQTPLGGTTVAWNNTTGAAVVPSGIVGAVWTFSGASNGHSITVTYKYTLSAVQSRAQYGDLLPGGFSGNVFGVTGVARRGRIFTSAFDSSKEYRSATAIKLAAAGLVTDQSGAGVAINAVVVSVPTADVPFLGLEFSAQ